MYVKQSGQTDKIYYAHADHLGSIVKLTDASGAEVFKASYDAWGKQTVTNSALNFYRGYTGHEHLPEFGLVNMNGRMYDPLLGRMLSPDPYVPDPYFSQDYNRYSYARNNPLVYTDPDGESILIASIIIGAIVGAYIGGSAANNTLDPTMWEWDDKDTWLGMGIGGVVGAVGGWGFAVAAPAVAGTAFFSYFGASGTVAAYGLVGTAAGGAVGYGAGFGSALYSSGGDWSYANKMGGIMSGVGAQIGSLAGMAAGGWAAYGTKLAQAGVDAATTATAAKETAKEVAKEGTKEAAKEVSERTYLVYQGFDKSGVVKYVGITGRDAAVRFGEHLNSGTARSLLRYEVVPGATNLSKTSAHIWEQNLINQHGLNNLLNIRNSIAPKYWFQYGIKP